MSDEIIIVGLGPGPVEMLTEEARTVLGETERVFFRYGTHPVARMLMSAGKDVISFERLYADRGMTYGDVYKLIVKAIVQEAKLRGHAVLALPGNPYVFEKTPRWIAESVRNEPDVKIKIVPGMSFLELLYPFLGIDPEEGLMILNAARIIEEPERCAPISRMACIIGQVGLPASSKPTAGEVNTEKLINTLLKTYPPDHPVVIARCRGFPDYATEKIETRLKEVGSHAEIINNLTSLYLPPIAC